MKLKRNGSGYLIIDHRASPGLPNGLGIIPGVETPKFPSAGKVFEVSIVQCAHACGSEIILNPDRVRPRNHCAKCDAYYCDKPGCRECVPIQKIVDEIMESASRNLNIGEI
jgi:hypothetical protein